MLVLLNACIPVAGTRRSTVVYNNPEPAPAPTNERYVVEPGGSADVVATFRAEPAPQRPDISDGSDLIADKNTLSGRRFVHIGTSYFSVSDLNVNTEIFNRALAVGADKVLVYPASPAADGHGVIAAYFVRFKLAFGATFRDLTARERNANAIKGGVEIGKVIINTPAAVANLLSGDIVVSVDGRPVTDKSDFQAQLQERAGHRVTMQVLRGGALIDRVIQLGPGRSE